MNTGPKALSGFDLSITEMLDAEVHYFIMRAGSLIGKKILAQLPTTEITDARKQEEKKAIDYAVDHMGRQMDTKGIKELLYNNLEHPQWDKVAERCLSCANCTMACPTCFCSTVEDVTDLTGEHAERWREWDSCFNLDFTYIHGGHNRASGKSRYRQWMTHKLASWQDQFNSSGCVGCGRCVTWCPVGIDITEEVKEIRNNQPAKTNLKDIGG
jgi:predicted aldo/keto reductase-like oxidoreductase